MRVHACLKSSLILLLSLGLLGCAETNFASHLIKKAPWPDGDQGGAYKIGEPYQINGVWYYPEVNYQYDEVGVASWYGPGFHQKYTANGEIFNQYSLTAAHKTLPLPSVIRVTNMENGRSLVVRVNDRGPFAQNRILDVSERVAELLGFKDKGTAKVRVTVMEQESRQLAQDPGSNFPDQVTKNWEQVQHGTQPTSWQTRTQDPKPMPAEPVKTAAPVYDHAGRGPAAAAPTPLTPADQMAAPTPTTGWAPPPAAVVPAQPMVSAPAPQVVPDLAPEVNPAKRPLFSGGAMQPGAPAGQAPMPQSAPGAPEQASMAAPAVGRGIFVQAASFGNPENAGMLSAQLAPYGPTHIEPVIVNDMQFYRVYLGPFDRVTDAEAVLQRVTASGYQDAKLILGN